MPDAELDIVFLAERLDGGTHILRRHGLAQPADIVALAFHGQKRGLADGARVDLAVAIGEDAARQMLFLEHLLHRFQIEFGGQVGDGKILIIEFAVGVGLGELAFAGL